MTSLITIVEDDPRVDRFVVHESVHREVKMRAFFAHCLTNVAKNKDPGRCTRMAAPEHVGAAQNSAEHSKTNAAQVRTTLALGRQNGQTSMEALEHGRTSHSAVL